MKQVFSAVLLCALLSAPLAAEVDTDNVVVVLDASGSMSEKMGGAVKMEAAKRAIAEVLANVPDTTQVGLLVFSGSGKPDDWVYPLGPRDDAALLRALAPVEPSGSTPLGAYMKVGADHLLQAREEQLGYGTYRLLIVTDGEASDADLLQAYTPDILARGIVVDVIGVAMRADHELAARAHSYRRADDPASLQQALAEVLGEVSDQGGSQADQEAFDLLEGLPGEVAAGMIAGLAAAGNTPIREVTSEIAAAGKGGRPAAASGAGSNKRSSRFVFYGVVVLAFIAWSLFKSSMRRR